ncbi:hypothetical protein TRVL_06294 [Trypanosoma vivax]|nr:hypothetical protein TRVL_06294 [Trypanosoma vivax]
MLLSSCAPIGLSVTTFYLQQIRSKMDTEEGEFVVYGNSGSAEDAQFDQIVGAIEDFMMSFDHGSVFKSLPPFASVASDHDKHQIHRDLLARISADLDECVLQRCEGVTSMTDVMRLLEERCEEVSDDVRSFVREGFFDYSTFVEEWEEWGKKDLVCGTVPE